MTSSATSLLPTRVPSLNPGAIHLWHASVDLMGRSPEDLLSTLSPDERAKSESFRFEKDRLRYGISRGILRNLLGSYLNVEPASVRICVGAFGKPYLSPEFLPNPIHFSVSYSNGHILFAFSPDQEIGVDLEHIQLDFEFENIAKTFFSPGELSELSSLAPLAKSAEFFRLWTRLEAYAKARGTGISLFDCSVTFHLHCPDQSPQPSFASQEIHSWSIEHFTPEPNFIAALACGIPGSALSHFRYPDSLQLG
jgi:4'-phosphopantetheinyl transferase